MKKTKALFACLVLVMSNMLAPNLADAATVDLYPITAKWKIKKLPNHTELTSNDLHPDLSGNEWIPAIKMPAMVQDILQQNQLIEEPWLPGKAKEYQWIAESDWLYHTTFKAQPDGNKCFLNFKGLDGIVDIYLNGSKIASHQNMFMPLQVEVGKALKDENTLLLHFKSVFSFVEGIRSPLKEYNGHEVRRPDQSYINYLGPDPCFSRVGVFNDILLESTHGTFFQHVSANTFLSEDYTKGQVTIECQGESNINKISVQAEILDQNGKVVSKTKASAEVTSDKFNETITLTIDNPSLWWPRGYGKQNLYTARISLLTNKTEHQQIEKTVGFRKLEMADTLHFVINGKPVRLWGGCWVSPDWTTAVWDQQRAEKLFALAENANFNALRVWGVVEGPPDAFYEMGDRQGILIWNDFVNMPLNSSPKSQAIYRMEVPHYVNRLKNHPSVIIWCGGNENALWHHQEYNGNLQDRGKWPGIDATDEIRSIIRELDPTREFFPSTPYYGIDPNDPAHGNTHGYTNMWFVPGYDYLNFASEDTRIAAPVLHSCERFMAQGDVYPDDYSPVFTHESIYPYPKTWLKYTTSTSWKKLGPIEHYFDATDAASLIYRIGMAEAEYYRTTVEMQRRGRPANDTSMHRRCGGYLVWKFNDSWPQVYSAKVDFFLEPLHAYYALKHAYAPVHLSFDMSSYITLWAINDSPDTIKGTVTLQLLHMDRNEVRKEIIKEVSVAPDQSLIAIDLYKESIGTFRLEHVLFAKLEDANGNLLASTHQLADIERNLHFPDAQLSVQRKGNELIITTDKFAKSITLTGDENGDKFGWFFSDNYFDLMPGENKVVKVLGEHKNGEISIKPWYSSHEKVINWKVEK